MYWLQKYRIKRIGNRLPHHPGLITNTKEINIIVVLCSENFDMALTQGYVNSPQPGKDITALIDFEYFFRRAESGNPIQCLKKGNFLKFFIVRNSFGKNGGSKRL